MPHPNAGRRARVLRRPQLQALGAAFVLATFALVAGVLGRARASVGHISLAMIGVCTASLVTQHLEGNTSAMVLGAVMLISLAAAVEHALRVLNARPEVYRLDVACSFVVAATCAVLAVASGAAAVWPAKRVRWRRARFWWTMAASCIAMTTCGCIFAITPLFGLPLDGTPPNELLAYALNVVSIPLNLCMLTVALKLDVRMWLFGRVAGSVSERAAGLAMRLTTRATADPHLRARALARFRHVQAEKLEFVPFAAHERDPSLHAIATESSALGDVDAFVSHSWYDDPVSKWEALQGWIAAFRQQHARDPRLWFDKFCIDQHNIEEDLTCLPLFLAGCRRVIVLAGRSYLQRRWCVTELWLYMQMGGRPHMADVLLLPSFDGDAAGSFDVEDTQCSNAVEGEQLLEAFEASEGGADHFNRHIRRLFKRRLEMRLHPEPSGDTNSDDGSNRRLSRFSPLKLARRAATPSTPVASRATRQDPPQVVLISDPGPDPDDAKAILVLATQHVRRVIDLKGVVCNGGGRPEDRAALAAALLDSVGAGNVPVGVGSAGNKYEPAPHEFGLAGYSAVDRAARLENGHALLKRIMREAAPKSLRLVCISSLRDACDMAAEDEDAFTDNVARVSVQGGVEWDAALREWRPDASVNNTFDMKAAAQFYAMCMRRGVPLRVVSRHAIPHIPMQLARSFADRAQQSPVMVYLADAQSLGLCALWLRVCSGDLPPRCTKSWFFKTFCGIGTDAAAAALSSLDAQDDILPYLNGSVKPYDVVAVMAVLPSIERVIEARGTVVRSGGAEHRFLLAEKECVPSDQVTALLRETYNHVLALSGVAQPTISPLAPSVNNGSERRGVGGAARGGSGDRWREDRSFLLVERNGLGAVAPTAVVRLIHVSRQQAGRWVSAACTRAAATSVLCLVACALGFIVIFALVFADLRSVVFLYSMHVSLAFHLYYQAVMVMVVISLQLLLFASREEQGARQLRTVCQGIGGAYALACGEWAVCVAGAYVGIVHGRAGRPVSAAPLSYHVYELTVSCFILALWVCMSFGMATAGEPRWMVPCGFTGWEAAGKAGGAAHEADEDIIAAGRRSSVKSMGSLKDSSGWAISLPVPGLRRPSVQSSKSNASGSAGFSAGSESRHKAAHIIVRRMQTCIALFLMGDSLLSLAQAVGQHAFGARTAAEVAPGYLRVALEMAAGLTNMFWPPFIHRGRLAIARAAGLSSGDKAWLAPLVDAIGPAWHSHNLHDAVALVAHQTIAWSFKLDLARQATLARDLGRIVRVQSPAMRRLWASDWAGRPGGGNRSLRQGALSGIKGTSGAGGGNLRSSGLSSSSRASSSNVHRAASVQSAAVRPVASVAAAAARPEPSPIRKLVNSLPMSPTRQRRAARKQRGWGTSESSAVVMAGLEPPPDTDASDDGFESDATFPAHSEETSAVDWYVIMAPGEDAEACAAVLCALTDRFYEDHARAPLVWLDGVHGAGDGTQSPAPAALPARLAVCRRLIVLIGPHFKESLWCALQVFCWFRVGGKHADVDVLPVLPVALAKQGGVERAQEGRKLVADLDTFHAMFARVSTSGERDEDVPGLIDATRLLHADRVNEAVSSLLPQLQSALVADLAVVDSPHTHTSTAAPGASEAPPRQASTFVPFRSPVRTFRTPGPTVTPAKHASPQEADRLSVPAHHPAPGGRRGSALEVEDLSAAHDGAAAAVHAVAVPADSGDEADGEQEGEGDERPSKAPQAAPAEAGEPSASPVGPADGA